MTEQELKLLDRITVTPGMMNGRPVIRGLRFPVQDIIEYLASGMTPDEILEEHPVLEAEDIKASLLLAAMRIKEMQYAHAA